MTGNDDVDDRLSAVAIPDVQAGLLSRRAAEATPIQQTEWLRITLASIGDAVITTDADGRVTYMNRVAEALTGWPQSEAIARPLCEIFHIVNERTRAIVEDPALRALQLGDFVSLAKHTVLIARDGSERPIDDSAAPIRDDFGNARGAVLVFRDITERKRAEAALARLASIVESSEDAIVTKTLAGVVLSWNAGAERIFGYTAAEAVGKSINLIVPPERRDEERMILERLARGERIEHFETLRSTKDGRRRAISVSISPIRDPEGQVVGASKVARDISGRSQAEEQLRQSEERLRLAMDAGNSGVWDYDFASKKLTWSERIAEFFGVTLEEFDGTLEYFARMVHPQDKVRIREAGRVSVETGEPYQIEYRIVRTTGEIRWIFQSTTVFLDEFRRPIRMIGAVSDVTGLRKAEAHLRESEMQFQRLATAGIIGVIRWDLDRSLIVDANDEFLRMTGYDRADLAAGRLNFRNMTPPEWTARNEIGIEGLRTSGVGGAYEKEYYRKDGSRVAVIIVGVRFEDSPCEGMSFVLDITERKRAEDALRDADRKKDEFIALLAHELRNPLAPLRNGLQIMRLANSDLNAISQARAMMERQLSHMVRLVDDLLDISRISQNKMELRRDRVLLADIVHSAVETSRPAIEAAGHTLAIELPAEPIPIDADLTRLAQVFSNLMTNSAKYTERGGRIWIAADRMGPEVMVSVRDNGIGIPEESLPTIFDMFSQVDRSIERSTGGLGIGLALVKALVEMHGGSVAVASKGQGMGSTFTVKLPTLTSSAEPSFDVSPEREITAGGPRRRILVVDDNRDSANSMAMMLKLIGNEVRIAHDGVEGIEAAEEFRPQIILMDVGMPRLTGYEATRRIREQPWGRSIFIIALTGWGQDGDKLRSQEAGCNGHLVKPVSLSDLENLLADLGCERTCSAPRVPPRNRPG